MIKETLKLWGWSFCINDDQNMFLLQLSSSRWRESNIFLWPKTAGIVSSCPTHGFLLCIWVFVFFTKYSYSWSLVFTWLLVFSVFFHVLCVSRIFAFLFPLLIIGLTLVSFLGPVRFLKGCYPLSYNLFMSLNTHPCISLIHQQWAEEWGKRKRRVELRQQHLIN